MALIVCPECGKEISDKATTCIHCGYPISPKTVPTKIVFVVIGIVAIALLCVIIAISFFGRAKTDSNPNGGELSETNKHQTITEADNETMEQSPTTEMSSQLVDLEKLIARSKDNVQPYLDVMGADITNGNPPVSQDFIDNLDSVEIMGHVGSVEHGYNIYDGKTYIELMTWSTNKTTTNIEFYDFVDLMDSYFDQAAILVSYDHIDDEIYGWVDLSKQFSMITYYRDNKIYLQWDVRLDFEDEETLTEATSPTKKEYESHGKECIECGKSASYTYTNPFSGQNEDYCYTHYKEILDIIDMMEEDVGQSDYSKHTCEECSREGTHRYESFTGQTEYYCTTHYNELMEMLNSLGIG